jgi:ankyrin repeat protein
LKREKVMAKAGMALAVGLFCAGCASGPDRGRLSQELIIASRQGDAKRVHRLIRAGADLNAVDLEGWTPYLAASVEGNWKVMKILKDNGCKTDPGY